MSRWAAFLTFGFGFVFAFGGTAVLTYLGANPVWMWGLIVFVGIWLWQLPDMKGDPKMTLLSLYAFPFNALWMLSNPTPVGSIKTFAYEMILACLGLASALAVYGTHAYYKRNPELKPIIRAFLALLVCCWMVAFFSSSTGAASHLIGFLEHVLGFDKGDADLISLVGRKSLHFLFYGTVGFLSFRLAKQGGVKSKAVLLALLFVLFHASFDEIRQAGYADRTGSFWDVCLDMTGGACFVLTASAVTSRRTKRVKAQA